MKRLYTKGKIAREKKRNSEKRRHEKGKKGTYVNKVHGVLLATKRAFFMIFFADYARGILIFK